MEKNNLGETLPETNEDFDLSKTAYLVIREESWSDGDPAKPTEAGQTVRSGDVISLEWLRCTAEITVVRVDDESVTVSFSTRGVVKTNGDGTVNLRSKEYEWTEELRYGESCSLATQTMDAGYVWTICFEK